MVLAADRLAAIMGICVFLGFAAVLAHRFGQRLNHWATGGLIVALLSARLGYVVENWEAFASEPWRALTFWQGGFRPMIGMLGLAVVSPWYLRSWLSGAAAAGIAGVGLLTWSVVNQLTAVTLGQPAPTVSFEQLDGPTLALSDLRGRPVIVNVWATWCPPCRSEMPLLARTAQEYPDVVFVLANQGESADRIRTYLAGERISFTHVLLDKGMNIPRYYATRGIPITLFLRADGSLADMHTGTISNDMISQNITNLMRQSKS